MRLAMGEEVTKIQGVVEEHRIMGSKRGGFWRGGDMECREGRRGSYIESRRRGEGATQSRGEEGEQNAWNRGLVRGGFIESRG